MVYINVILIYIFLSRIKSFLSGENRMLITMHTFLPMFDFSIIWGTCKTALEDRLVRFQKRAANILDLDCLTLSALLFNTYKWVTIRGRVVYHKALQLYTTIHCDSHDYLLHLHLKSIHGYFGLPQHIMCTHPDLDMHYSAIHLHCQVLLSGFSPC